MELKTFDVGLGQYCEDGSPCVVAFDADRNPRLLNEKVYLKSEADKVIAELKKRAQLNIKQEESNRHQKYKRCLAMAKLCHWKMGVFIYKKEKSDFYCRWHKRWQKLAEKFKEAK